MNYLALGKALLVVAAFIGFCALASMYPLVQAIFNVVMVVGVLTLVGLVAYDTFNSNKETE